jgi:putative resolvase
MKRGGGSAISCLRREIAYVRVPGSPGQESSLAGQEEELRVMSAGVAVKAVKDRGSGLRERAWLEPGAGMAGDGAVTVVRVRHEDRLARFRCRLAQAPVRRVWLHPRSPAPGKPGGRMNSLEDFVSLVITFAGGLCGMRLAGARKRLLAGAG